MEKTSPAETTRKIQLEIPFRTFLKVLVAASLTFVLIRLLPLVLLFILAGLIAFALDPLVNWMVNRKIRRWAALSIVVLFVIGALALFIFAILPQLFSQISTMSERIGLLKNEAMSNLPPGSVRNFVGHSIENPSALLGSLPSHLAKIGTAAINSLWSIGVFLVLAIYFLVDGGKAYRWFLGFFRPSTQTKLHRTTDDLQSIVFAYVSGQMITSLLVAIYAFTVDSLLGVPGALTLAVIAAIFDVLPIIGFLASTICAVILALTVSTKTALIVAACYVAYQALENYLIVPRVYGQRMKLSTLVVLISFLIAGKLAGVAGALIVLPIVASYPVIEKIWLKRYLGDEVVKSHQEDTEKPVPLQETQDSRRERHHEPLPVS